MANSDISLTSGMRRNVTSLQKTVELLNRTQERLGTGKKVNSALDNPTSYFAAQSHLSRATDLSARKEGMSEAIQVVRAADAGITGISELIDSAKGLAQAARSATTAERSSLASQFDSLLTQINNLATDASYKGKNLLQGENLTVEFNENGSNTLTVQGFTASYTQLNISKAFGNGAKKWEDDTDIDASVAELDAAQSTLRSESAKLAANLSAITVRQDFTTAMISTLTEGADNLTLADMNEEGANMLMLQTRQALGTVALSLSSEAAQSVLRLF